MKAYTHRLRMFAGPNGSGKSTLKALLPEKLLGVYLNADEIEAFVQERGDLDLRAFHVETNTSEVQAFFTQSTLIQDKGLIGEVPLLAVDLGHLVFTKIMVNSYWTSVAVDFIRQKLLSTNESFTFETVMSHPGKIDILAQAQRLGYRTYLYYIATDDPAINIDRVHYRVTRGGHDVPVEKIVSRYYRSLDLLIDAIKHTNRAYVWDNSGSESIFLAEITDGCELEIKTDQVPAWFDHAVLRKIQPQ